MNSGLLRAPCQEGREGKGSSFLGLENSLPQPHPLGDVSQNCSLLRTLSLMFVNTESQGCQMPWGGAQPCLSQDQEENKVQLKAREEHL